MNRPPTLLCGLRSCCESHSISSYSLSCSCRAGNNSLLALSVALGILSLPPSLPCTNAASQPLLWLKDLLLNFPDWLASSQSFRAQSMRTLLCCGCDCCRSASEHHLFCMIGHLCCASISIQKPLSNAVCLLAEPKLPDFEANFRRLLVRSRYNRPKENVIKAVVRRLAARMIVCSNTDQAEDLYHDASLLPGASTAEHLLTQHNLRVNGPLYLRCEGRQNASPFGCLGMQEVDRLAI